MLRWAVGYLRQVQARLGRQAQQAQRAQQAQHSAAWRAAPPPPPHAAREPFRGARALLDRRRRRAERAVGRDDWDHAAVLFAGGS